MTAPAIIVRVRPLEETRTPNSSCVWLAECEVGGRRFEARSRHGAPNALARELADAGIPDRQLEVYFEGLAGCLRWARSPQQQSGPTRKAITLCNASDGSPAGCRADYQSGVRTRGTGSRRYRRTLGAANPRKGGRMI